ncbi:hypothetical protein Q8A67_001519 [Cirrhinus molitorella]|uniref:Pyrin domain-containing protein n=1 Tax=Cirrhinus molitorella TaxID=172907 RepID=A0AA88QHW1_9TELE|nr:hypothetical protein Q8A67_001519 [Cirrhinus molitorella]
MTTLEELLLETLEDLSGDKLKTFKWHLKNIGRATAADLKKEDTITDTVDLVVSRCGRQRAVETTLAILKNMKENQLAEQLEIKAKDVIIPTTGSENSERRPKEENNMREPDNSLQDDGQTDISNQRRLKKEQNINMSTTDTRGKNQSHY